MTRNIHRQRLCVLALLIGGLFGPPVATGQQIRAVPKQPRTAQDPGRLWAGPRTSAPRLQLPMTLVSIGEVEPNDGVPSATPAALGDTVVGAINPTGDIDYFAFDLPAGTDVLLDVDASQFGSSLDPILVLIDRDGNTQLAYNDDDDGLDSRLHYIVPATGRYFAAIVDYSSGGGANYFYSLRIGVYVPPTPGPGDPTTPFAQGMSYPLGIAAAPTGGFYVADFAAGSVVRVGATGSASNFAQVPNAIDLAIDSYGDLLVAAREEGVYRLTAAGTRTGFVTGFFANAITIDAAGDVWVGGWNENLGTEIRQYDARGGLKETIDVGIMPGMADLAFSPTSQLFATSGNYGVYRISSSGATEVVLPTPLIYPEGIAFDEDGYVYIANGLPGEIHLYDPSFREIGSIFARSNLSGPILLAFGRNSSGGMTSRLFATNGGLGDPTDYPGAVLEVNQAGVRAAGFPIGATRPVMALEAVADAFLGDPSAISAEQAEFLDQQGNDNGRLDVADFRVFLRLLNASARTAGRVSP